MKHLDIQKMKNDLKDLLERMNQCASIEDLKNLANEVY